MTTSSFVVPLKKWGNSYVLKVPPQIAKLYKIGDELIVTIKHNKPCCEICGSPLYVMETRDGLLCEICADKQAVEEHNHNAQR